MVGIAVFVVVVRGFRFRHGAVSFLKNRGNARPEGRAFQPVEKSYQEGAFLFCLPQLQPFSDYASTEKV